jgi:hypothetical protein
MTSKAPTWRLGRYGGGGPWTVLLTPEYVHRYRATALGDPPAIRSITLTDRTTGAALTIRPDATAEDVQRLWTDARAILPIARRQTGGPPVGTGLRASQVIAKMVELWDSDPLPDGTAPTEAGVAKELTTTAKTIGRVGRQLAGAGTGWARLLRDARIARQHDVQLASSRSGPSVMNHAIRDGRHDEPPPMVTGHADPAADESGQPPIARRR